MKKAILLITLCSISPFIQSQSLLIEDIRPETVSLTAGQQNRLKHYQDSPAFSEVRIIRFGNLQALQSGGALPIYLPGNPRRYIARAKHVETHEQGYYWYGEIEGGGMISLQVNNGKVNGQLVSSESSYSIKNIGNGFSLLLESNPDLDIQCASGLRSDQKPLPPPTHSPERTENSSTEVRVLVLYTQAAANVGDPYHEASLYVNQLNQALRNSGITYSELRFTLTKSILLNGFVEFQTGLIEADLDLLRTNTLAKYLRNQYEADIVVLLTNGGYTFQGSFGPIPTFGIAYLEESGLETHGYAICEIDAPAGRYTFEHEVAHLFGARHDANDGLDGLPNIAPYARGHNFDTGWFLWKKNNKTILNFLASNTNDSRIHYFSNPLVNYNEVATGITNSRDNARILRERAETIASYRYTAPPMSLYISGPSSGVNFQSYNWCPEISNCSKVTSYQWEYSIDGFAYYPLATSECVTSTLPHNQDYHLRVTATCSDGATASGYLFVYNQSKSNGGYERFQTEEEIPFGREKKLQLYPNPVSNRLQVTLMEYSDTPVTFSIFDASGKKLAAHFTANSDAQNNPFSLDLSAYPNGVYYLHAVSTNNTMLEKFVIQR